MISWLRKLLGLCQHKWRLLEKIKVFDNEVSKDRPVAFLRVLQCENCGWIRKVRT